MTPTSLSHVDHVLLRRAEPDLGAEPLLSWSQPPGDDRLVQVYINGQLYDVSTDSSQRRMWLTLDRLTPVRIELLAVDAADVWTDFSDELDAWTPAFTSTAELEVVRDESLPIDSRVIVSVDDVDEADAALWGAMDSRGGFGGLFGVGPFGYDTATSPGFGLGEFAAGSFGWDGHAWRWRRDDLPAGSHTITLHIEDGIARTVASLDAKTVTLDAPPVPVTNLSIDPDFTLRWD